MKKIVILLIGLYALFSTNACTTYTTELGYKQAAEGDTKVVHSAMPMSGDDLHKAAMIALRAKKWTISDAGNPIKASISRGGQDAKLTISIDKDTITFDTKGSKIGDKPYVPIRHLNSLYKTMMSHYYKTARK